MQENGAKQEEKQGVWARIGQGFSAIFPREALAQEGKPSLMIPHMTSFGGCVTIAKLLRGNCAVTLAEQCDFVMPMGLLQGIFW